MSASNYQIIDEPKPRLAEKFVIPPIFILLAGILIPIVITLPFYGRFWMPFVWLGFNGFALGSPSLKKEVLYGVLVCALVWGILYLTDNHLPDFVPNPRHYHPYIILILNGVLFTGLYMTVFTQSTPYEIFAYTQEQRRNNRY